ncbi:hypothetical protein HYW39_00965 [Candidatus Curtissbacteria bacterium]|nr:hypothetical protein [Candidatus Curtissbacteria bacterium]
MTSKKKRTDASIVVMIGAGSKLPALIRAASAKRSPFHISLVVSHRSFSPGVGLAISQAVHFKLPDYRSRIFGGSPRARSDYMKRLGWFISQREYKPSLLVFAGWDLVVDENFFNFFKVDFGEGYAAINLHPSLLVVSGEKNAIILPDRTKSPIIKGEQQEVLETVLRKKLTYFGPSVHFMVPSKYDTGQVIGREFIKVDPHDTVELLRKKLMPVEDRILVESVNEVIMKYS